MSIASPFRSEPADRRIGFSPLRTAAVQSVRGIGFWTAVVVPLAYPALFVGGLGGQQLLFSALVVANVLGLVLGHEYHSE